MSKIRSATLGLAVLLLLLGARTVLAGNSANYAIDWQCLDGGGGSVSSAGGNVTMTGSVGQPVIGPVSSTTYWLGSGYEYRPRGQLGESTYLPLMIK